MKRVNLFHAVLGGFVGTLVMTTLLYLAPLMGMPRMDIAAQLGSLIRHGTPATMTGLWWAGMIWHFVNGTIIFSLIYSYFVYGWLTGENWLRGAIWGLVLWIAMEVAFLPMAGSGIFGDRATASVKRVFIGFVLHAIYGAVMGAIAGEQVKHPHRIPHPA